MSTANLMLGVPCDGLASHPGGSRNTASRFLLQKLEIRAGLIGHLACMQTIKELPNMYTMTLMWRLPINGISRSGKGLNLLKYHELIREQKLC